MREPRGIERITRHGFFVGVFLLGAAHALLATRLIGAVLMGGLALFALLGARLQDRKLLRLRGPGYADYLAATSLLPFAAVAAGRQRIVWSELPVRGALVGLAIAFAIRWLHVWLFDFGGIYLIAPTVGGAFVLGLMLRRRERRTATPEGVAGAAG